MLTIVPEIVTAAEPPVDLSEARAFIQGLEADEEDDTSIEGMIATAFDFLQPPTGVLSKSIAPQTLRVDLPAWPDCFFPLPAGPVTAISSIKYYDANNVDQTLDAAPNYFVDKDRIVWTESFSAPEIYLRPSAVRIEYVAGLATLPHPLRMAILRITKRLFDFRDELHEGLVFDPVAFGVDSLIMPWRQR